MIKVTGHALEMAGAAHADDGCGEPVCLVIRPGMRVNASKGGHGQCSCGRRSPHLWSNRERQRWHRSHKDLVLETEALQEQGRQLASRRDDLIASGVDPRLLDVPIAPEVTW